MRPADLVLIAEARAAAADGSARLARQGARLKQAEVAKACGVAPSTVAMWEAGLREPRGTPALAYGRFLRALAAVPGGLAAGALAA